LKDFVVTLDTSVRLAEAMPETIVKVSESGIHSYQDIEQLRQSGYNCFLIGEALVTSDDPAAELKSLRGV
jgi:indole-3-glycerol phosphate synthase